MARPRKYSSEAERKRASRARLNPDKPDTKPDKPGAKPDKPGTNLKLACPETEPESPNPDKPCPVTPAAGGEPPGYSARFVRFLDQVHVPHDPMSPPWMGAGRGVARDWQGRRYVLIARHRGAIDLSAPEHGVVTEADYRARLAQRCAHSAGWACHYC